MKIFVNNLKHDIKNCEYNHDNYKNLLNEFNDYIDKHKITCFGKFISFKWTDNKQSNEAKKNGTNKNLYLCELLSLFHIEAIYKIIKGFKIWLFYTHDNEERLKRYINNFNKKIVNIKNDEQKISNDEFEKFKTFIIEYFKWCDDNKSNKKLLFKRFKGNNKKDNKEILLNGNKRYELYNKIMNKQTNLDGCSSVITRIRDKLNEKQFNEINEICKNNGVKFEKKIESNKFKEFKNNFEKCLNENINFVDQPLDIDNNTNKETKPTVYSYIFNLYKNYHNRKDITGELRMYKNYIDKHIKEAKEKGLCYKPNKNGTNISCFGSIRK